MSALLYDVCISDLFLPVLCLLYCKLSFYLSDVFLPVWLSSHLFDACLHVWHMLNCIVSAYLFDVCCTSWCLSTYIGNFFLPLYFLLCFIMFIYLHDFCSTIWCTFFLYVCSTVWCLPTCMTPAYLNDFLPSWCFFFLVPSLPNRVMSTLSILCLLNSMTSAKLYESAYFYDLYDVCLPVWCVPTCTMSARLYYVRLLEWCLVKLYKKPFPPTSNLSPISSPAQLIHFPS